MSRGLSLPMRGSPRDRVLRELLQREQVVRATEVSLVVRLLGGLAGVKHDNIDSVLASYFEEMTYVNRPAQQKRRSVEEEQVRRRLEQVTRLNSGTS